MALIVRLTDAPQVDVPAFVGVKTQPEKGYRLTLDGQRAIFHDASKEPPNGIREQPRLTDKHRGDIYVTPCAGIIESSRVIDQATEAKNESVVMSLLANIQERVAERHNVTVMVRNTQTANAMGNDYFDTLAMSVFGAVSNTAERALQYVADEQAKEKQMLRLLQSDENDGASQQQLVPKPPVLARPATQSSGKKTALDLSPSAQLRLRTMSAQREKSAHLSPRVHSARSRFTLLAASSESELLPPPRESLAGLVPLSFIVQPPEAAYRAATARRATVDATTKEGKASQRRQNQQARRRATMAMLESLAVPGDAVSVDPIKGNGWGTELRYLSFNGNSSVLALPSIPRFDEFIKSFQIDFWLKTDCKMADGKRNLVHVMEGQRAEVGMNFQIGLNFHSDFDEHIRIYIRDAGNRVMEVLAPLPMGFTSGHDFHHVMIRIKNIETGKIEVAIDGQPNDRLRYLQQEHPVSFNTWPHSRVYVGSYVDDANHVQQCLRGGLCELRLWRGGEAVPFQRWSLLGDRAAIAKGLESMTDLRESIHQPPETCPRLDGNTALNMGTLGVLGELLGTSTFEVRFKTSITGRSMSLVGVTDSHHKMMEVGIVLNAEPVLSKDRFRYHEHHITCYLVDANGACLSVLVRGTDRQNVMDGAWHTIQWKIIDSETNKVEVRIDGSIQDLLHVYRECPVEFCALQDFLCLGGHNVRNWKIRNTFTGFIKSFIVSFRGEEITSLALNEGPGAIVCQDSSGHHNHGLIIHAETNATRRNEIDWVPCLDVSLDEEADAKDGTAVASTIVIHKSNAVSLAAVRFGALFDPNGAIQESVVDLFSGLPVEIGVTDVHMSGQIKRGWTGWRQLPPHAFHTIENSAHLKEMIPAALKLNDKSGHMLLILRIGDCHVTLMDIIGPLVPPHASFDCNMMKWKYAIAMNGTKGKREQMLNQMVVGLEKMLVEVSSQPTIAARMSPENQTEHAVAANDLLKSLSASGIPSRLALVVHGLLLNAEYASHLHVVYSCPRLCNEEEAASVAIVCRSIQKACEGRAAKLIQRNWRGRMARNRVQVLEQQRKLRKQQVEEILSLRRANPLVQPKKNMRAIVITAHDFLTDTLPAIQSFNVSEIIDALKKQGYNVEHVKNPNRAAVNKAIGSIEPDSSTFVYVSGYGGAIRVRQTPMFSQYRLHTMLAEGSQRASLELECTNGFRHVAMAFFSSLHDVLQQEAAKASKKQGKKGATKNAAAQAQQARHVEENFRVAREELLKDETENRTLRLQKEYEHEVALIQKEIRQVTNAAQDFEDNYRSKIGDTTPMNFFLPSDCRSVEPIGSEVFNVEDFVFRTLQRQLPPMGFQAVVAVDLVPMTPGACGLGILASSTGHTFQFPYEPEQRHVLSWHLRKALQGYMPKVAVKSKEAILQGAVETSDTQRDWRSLATYVAHKMIDACHIPSLGILGELSRETAYTADLVPIRNVVTADGKEKARRELESRRAQGTAIFAVDSLKVTSDMTSEFKSFIQHVTINETIHLGTVLLTFLHNNNGIDGLRLDGLAAEVDRCAPANSQEVKYQLTLNAQGVAIAFSSGSNQAGDKQKIQHWINSVAARSISWRIPTIPFASPKELEVERIELLFAVKVAANQRKMKHFMRQRMMTPMPYPTIRFMNIILD